MCSNPHMIVEHKNKKTEINGWERNKEDSKRRELADEGWDSSSFMPYYILKQCGFFWSLGSLGSLESIGSLESLGPIGFLGTIESLRPIRSLGSIRYLGPIGSPESLGYHDLSES